MLKFKLIEETDKIVKYKYFPENSTDFGVVYYEKNTKKIKIVALSSIDKHQRYAQKMCSRLKKYADDNTFETQGVIAWV